MIFIYNSSCSSKNILNISLFFRADWRWSWAPSCSWPCIQPVSRGPLVSFMFQNPLLLYLPNSAYHLSHRGMCWWASGRDFWRQVVCRDGKCTCLSSTSSLTRFVFAFTSTSIKIHCQNQLIPANMRKLHNDI